MLKDSKEDIVEPLEIREDELLMVHTQEYLNSLKVSPTPFTLQITILFIQYSCDHTNIIVCINH